MYEKQFYRNPLLIIFWDVEHGNAIFIKTPNKKNIIFDLGTYDINRYETKFNPLRYLKERYKITHIDCIFITHPDYDHISEILNLNLFTWDFLFYPKNIPISEIYKKINRTNISHEKQVFEKYLSIIGKYNKQKNTYIPNPLIFNNNGGVSFKTYFPSPSESESITNNYSLVLIIEYGGYKIILTGDNQIDSWRYLINQYEFIKDIRDTNIFLASHHGRENGLCYELFSYIKPYLTIISDGRAKSTNASSEYSSLSKGYNVYSRSGYSEKRKCLTTRSDGVLTIKIGYKEFNCTYMNVFIN